MLEFLPLSSFRFECLQLKYAVYDFIFLLLYCTCVIYYVILYAPSIRFKGFGLLCQSAIVLGLLLTSCGCCCRLF